MTADSVLLWHFQHPPFPFSWFFSLCSLLGSPSLFSEHIMWFRSFPSASPVPTGWSSLLSVLSRGTSLYFRTQAVICFVRESLPDRLSLALSSLPRSDRSSIPHANAAENTSGSEGKLKQRVFKDYNLLLNCYRDEGKKQVPHLAQKRLLRKQASSACRLLWGIVLHLMA